MLKCFWPADQPRPGTEEKGPRQGDDAFQRRYHMSKSTVVRVMNACTSRCGPDADFFRKGLRVNAAGKLGISPLVKIISAHRQIAYGIPSDSCDNAFEISETTASMCLITFCRQVVTRFASEYLREPSQDDIARIEKRFRTAGFPGCIGAVDCAGWKWKNCPKALQGIMIGKDGSPNLRMGAICDLDLWVWHFQFGFPGRNNDLHILNVSPHFARVLTGQFSHELPTYSIGDAKFDSYYYLADVIYPSWKIFVKSLQVAHGKQQEQYCRVQESARKCVESLSTHFRLGSTK